MQGQKADEGGEEQRYRIRIREETETHDNDDRSMRGSGGLLDDRGTTGCGSPMKGKQMRQRSPLEQVQPSKLD